MTRWCGSVRVNWLPPCQRKVDESSVQFSERVKSMISEAAGLQNLSWDGYLKNYRPTREKQDKMRLEMRQEYLKELFEKVGPNVLQDEEINCDNPELPVKDYRLNSTDDYNDDDEKASIDTYDELNFDQRLNKSRESLGIKFRQLRETFSPKNPSSSI